MNIQFYIHYNTRPGERICVMGSCPELGNWNPDKAVELMYSENGNWKGSVSVNDKTKQLKYRYLLKNDIGTDIQEWGKPHFLHLNSSAKKNVLVHDNWYWPGSDEKVLYSSAFSKVIMPSEKSLKGQNSRAKKQLEFRIRVPRIGNHYQVCILGTHKVLGSWNFKKPFLLSYDADSGDWKGSVDASAISGNISYKYGIFDSISKKLVTLEDGKDRSFDVSAPDFENYTLIKSDTAFRFPKGLWKGAGVSVPVFSLRTKQSFGVGEFGDLVPFIKWSKKIGLKMVQILPVNETIALHNWLDSYPYKSISVVALHPIYLNPIKMGRISDDAVMEEFTEKAKALNKLEELDYVQVMELKSKYYKMLFDQEKESFFETASYKKFFKENKDWLEPYAGYAYLRDKFKTPDFRKWDEFSIYDASKVRKLSQKGSSVRDDITIHYFIQYHLDKQLKEVTQFARENGIVLKGDIPIGISPNSVEAWTEPHLFNLHGQAGAPPDEFAIKGQNWGFPTYKWSEMAKESYQWWKNRLQKMNQYFDAYRIDHILGFFRIWEIPLTAVEGVMGYFNPSIPYSAEEIRQRGIHFDYDRFVKPYIHYHNLYDLFGMMMHDVIEKYLDEDGYDKFTLKPEFNTQLKINKHFLNGIEEESLTMKQRKIRDGLFDLVSDVLFLELGEDKWHPRVNFHSTSSFLALDDHTRHKLDDLYNDFYYRRHNDFWHKKGMEKLPAILSASDMLVCGEDLGMVPDCVPPVMKELDILSLEIQRMPKNPNKQFAHPADAPYLSVCTTSTHDMPTIRGWWELDRDNIQNFYNNELGNHGEAPYFAEPWICQQILIQHLHSTAMWTVFPVQDLISIDSELRWDETHKEQINKPSDVRHHWKYRMYQSVDDLKNSKDLNQLLRMLIDQSGRNSNF